MIVVSLRASVIVVVLIRNEIWYERHKLNPKKIALLAAGVFVLSGCNEQKPLPDEVAKALLESKAVDVQLAGSAGRIEQLMIELAGARAAGAMPVDALSAQSISMDFEGDATTLVRQIAKVANLRFDTRGRANVPLPVSIHEKDVPMLRILELIGYQLGQRADLVLTNDSLEIRYANP